MLTAAPYSPWSRPSHCSLWPGTESGRTPPAAPRVLAPVAVGCPKKSRAPPRQQRRPERQPWPSLPSPSAPRGPLSAAQPSTWHLQIPSTSPESPQPPQPPPSPYTSGPAPPRRMFTPALTNWSPRLASCPKITRPPRRGAVQVVSGEGTAATRRSLLLRPTGFPPENQAKPLGLRGGRRTARELGGRNHGKTAEE